MIGFPRLETTDYDYIVFRFAREVTQACLRKQVSAFLIML